MAEYRRFVAYVYVYRNGRKEENCGFVKVEVKKEKCTMEIHLQSDEIILGTECKVYGFFRENGKMKGVNLGKLSAETGMVKGVLETLSEKPGGCDVALERIGGMVFITETGEFFGTEWDDLPIVPDRFEEFQPEEEKEQNACPEQEEKVVMAEVKEEDISIGEAYVPFEDGEFVQCRKIKLGDIMCLSGKNCPLRQNRFLLYGYYNFGHLFLGIKENGQKVLGVPGIYDQQECFMAGMFGFPFFKKSRMIKEPEGKGGYWYRLINAPDANERNRLKQN